MKRNEGRERRGKGVLLMWGGRDAGAEVGKWVDGLCEAGYAVRVSRREQEMRDAAAWLEQAKREYVAMCSECGGVSVVGRAMGGVLALLLAEAYPVSAIATLDVPMSRAEVRALSAWGDAEAGDCGGCCRLIRRAHRNLFAIAAPLLTMRRADEAGTDRLTAWRIERGVCSGVRRSVWLTGEEAGSGETMIRFLEEYGGG